MRTVRNGLFAVSAVALLSPALFCIAGCDTSTNEGGSSAPDLASAVFPVEGMTCGACAARVKRTLKDIDGVADVEVSLAERNVRVRFADGKVTPERLAAAINELGYKASVPPPSPESDPEEPQAEAATNTTSTELHATAVTIPIEGTYIEGKTTPKRLVEEIDAQGFKAGTPTGKGE